MLKYFGFGLLLVVVCLLSKGIEANGPIIAVLGSGGHTGEMLEIISKLDLGSKIQFIANTSDEMSISKANKLGNKLYMLPRARNVGQGLISSAFQSLFCLIKALILMIRLKPRMLICNGPATSAVTIFAVRLLCLRTKVIYVESFARVNTLSLSGKLVYKLNLADRFLVQWPELLEKYPGTEYRGLLV